jgi:hypothetical protein
MTDRRLRDIDEDALENIIRGLPRREPDPSLRARVLSPPLARTHRGRVAARPVLAAAVVAALLLIDIIVLKVQGRGLSASSSPAIVAASPSTPTAADDDTTWLAEMLGEAAPARIAWLRGDAIASPHTYAALRASLLANGSGG